MALECGISRVGMDQKLIGTALLTGIAAFLFDPGSAPWMRAQLAPLLSKLPATAAGPALAPLGEVLPQLNIAVGILCLIAIPILWLKPN